MEVMVPVSDFHFDSTTSSPYVSAPSSPKRFGDPFDYYNHYTSAPTSPTRVAALFAASVPFDWDERLTETQSNNGDGGDGIDDFAFDFSGQLEKGGQPPDLTAADELFEKGKLKVRPLKPPPRLYNISSKNQTGVATSHRSPVSPKVGSDWSPRQKVIGGTSSERFDPAMVDPTRERGRERGQPSPYSISSSRSRRGSRSLSPMREGRGVGGLFLKSTNSPRASIAPTTAATTTTTTATIASECMKSGGGSRKWRLRDLLLFRSASEGRATGNRSKDPLRKYTILASSNSSASLFSNNKRGGEDSRNSSFRSTDGSGSMRRTTDVGSSVRRGNVSAVSAHEKHYMSNRIASEEMKKKTPLPYRQSLFSCLGFNPAVNSIAKGFHNSYSFGRRQN